jgi:hypothetical protein
MGCLVYDTEDFGADTCETYNEWKALIQEQKRVSPSQFSNIPELMECARDLATGEWGKLNCFSIHAPLCALKCFQNHEQFLEKRVV